MREFSFEKNDDKWYVILPEWKGLHEELEMVCGADILLDLLSNNGSKCVIMVTEELIIEPSFILEYKEDLSNGGIYSLLHETYNFDIWLCHVTKFVYGYLPNKLYCHI